MKVIQAIIEKKSILNIIWEAQHPVMNTWIVISFFAIGFLYAASLF